MLKSKQKNKERKFTVQDLKDLRTVEGKLFRCLNAKFSQVIPGLILRMSGTIEGDVNVYWWNQKGQCTTHNPKFANTTRKLEYDIDLSQLDVTK